jgi:hypothetical protein
MSWVTVSWPSNALPTETRFDAMQSRDEANLEQVEDVATGHAHGGGTDGLLLSYATDSALGTIRRFRAVVAVTEGAVGEDVYFTDDGTFGGTNFFNLDFEPVVFVYRGVGVHGGTDPEDGQWSDEGWGHCPSPSFPSGNGNNTDYRSRLLKYGGVAWYVSVWNHGDQEDLFLVIAFGKGP